MGGVFGKSKKQASRVTEQDKAVLVSEISFAMYREPNRLSKNSLHSN